MNPSYTAGSVICLISTMSMAMMKILQTLILLMDIPLDMRQIDFSKRIRLLFKISTSHCFEQFPHYQQYQPLLFLQYPNQKSKGTSYCSSRWKKYFTQVKAEFIRDFRKHPMLLSAYLKEPTPQSSAGSKLLPQQQKSVTPSPAKVFHSRNTLEVAKF